MSQKPKPLQSPLEKHPEMARALGMIGIEIGNLEFMLAHMLAAFLNSQLEIAQIIYFTPQSFMGRLQLLENVSEHYLMPDSDGLKRVRNLLKRARSRIQFRNDTMHSAWGVLAKDRSIVTRRSVPFLKRRPPLLVEITELQEEIAKLRVLADEIYEEAQALQRSRSGVVSKLSR